MEILEYAKEVLGDEQTAQEWLKTPIWFFHGLSPEEVAKVDPERVRHVLGCIKENDYTGLQIEIGLELMDQYKETLEKLANN